MNTYTCTHAKENALHEVFIKDILTSEIIITYPEHISKFFLKNNKSILLSQEIIYFIANSQILLITHRTCSSLEYFHEKY